MSSRQTWELAAEGALLEGAGYRHLRGNMLERFREMFPLDSFFYPTNGDRCLAFLFMAAIEDNAR